MPDLEPLPSDPGAIPGAARRPDGLYDCVLAGAYGPLKEGTVIEGVDEGRARWIAESIKPETVKPNRPSKLKEGTDG
jgi:hypothetical protein